jgi:hypothetical protein
MNIKCKLLAMAGGFTGTISQALPPQVLFPSFYISTVHVTPRGRAFGAVQKSGWGKLRLIRLGSSDPILGE